MKKASSMKYLVFSSRIIVFVFILYTLYFILNTSILGQTTALTPKPSPSITTSEEKDIQNLKEKVANKVAELRKQNNKGESGWVISLTANSFTIKGAEQKEYQVKLDESLTKYFQIVGDQTKEIQKETVEKGDYLIVDGLVKDSSIDANTIFIDEEYLVDSGKISQVDKENYSIKLVTSSKEDFILDIETTTKQLILNIKTLELERTGFSKIKEGDTVHFVVKKTAGEIKDNHYSAQKILIIPQEYFIK